MSVKDYCKPRDDIERNGPLIESYADTTGKSLRRIEIQYRSEALRQDPLQTIRDLNVPTLNIFIDWMLDCNERGGQQKPTLPQYLRVFKMIYHTEIGEGPSPEIESQISISMERGLVEVKTRRPRPKLVAAGADFVDVLLYQLEFAAMSHRQILEQIADLRRQGKANCELEYPSLLSPTPPASGQRVHSSARKGIVGAGTALQDTKRGRFQEATVTGYALAKGYALVQREGFEIHNHIYSNSQVGVGTEVEAAEPIRSGVPDFSQIPMQGMDNLDDTVGAKIKAVLGLPDNLGRADALILAWRQGIDAVQPIEHRGVVYITHPLASVSKYMVVRYQSASRVFDWKVIVASECEFCQEQATESTRKHMLKFHEQSRGRHVTKVKVAATQLNAHRTAHTKHAQEYADVLAKYAQPKEEYQRLESNSEEEQQDREKYKILARDQEQNLFVLVLVDGDGYVFDDDDLVSSRAEGGQRAAHLLNTAVTQSHQAKGLAECLIKLRIYANLIGLSKALSKMKLAGSEKRLLAPFVADFNRSNRPFEFVDAGELKENADFKIRSLVHLYAENAQCKHIYFAGCHDVGYINDLIQYTKTHNRITLVRTKVANHLEVAKVGLPSEEFPNIFRYSPLNTTTPRAPLFQQTGPNLASQQYGSNSADTPSIVCPF
ncbi:hypothetical protein DOTSEDRAFT_29815 [Dothistroma septosporum NZE10]|uniref:DUF7923 domain-containing protein n=1 Tax=Dothistroma septosporum (strain NZE10 / CBS 128990) TaxID=675120 RepID=N1PY38_DOTSN|nr:hypothetical protein DOTSEDRAFT_29815 [Dothistroma septosporum NZE10]